MDEKQSVGQVSDVGVSKELFSKLQGLDQITALGKLLEQGFFPGAVAVNLGPSLAFLKAMYDRALEDAKAHPEAHKVPALSQSGAQAPEVVRVFPQDPQDLQAEAAPPSESL